MLLDGFAETLPAVYVEPDDPDKAPMAAAIAQLKATFNTSRTQAQVNNSLDALTVLMRRVFTELH
jgi:hypothetical protein